MRGRICKQFHKNENLNGDFYREVLNIGSDLLVKAILFPKFKKKKLSSCFISIGGLLRGLFLSWKFENN